MTTARHITFALVTRFPLFGLACAVEVLRHANRFAERELYTWDLVSDTGGSVCDSNGLALETRAVARARTRTDAVFVVAGYELDGDALPQLTAWLRAEGKRDIPVGGISNGSFLLAHAGLLEGRPATVHFEDFSAFHQRFPTVRARYQRTVIDGNRMSCSGGTSTLDLLIEWLRREHAPRIASLVSQQMLLQALNLPPGDDAPLPLNSGPRYSTTVQRALDRLEASHAERLTVGEMARHVGLSRRELLRMFKRETGMTPGQAVRQRRVMRAQSLVRHTHLPLADVAIAVGYASQSHMTSHYRQHVGRTPAQDRRQH
ncbi:MAG: GlxA family transcriptional regulator [Pseudomonadota bacterium]